MIRAIIFDCFGVLYRDNLSLLYDLVPESSYQDLRDVIHATDHGYLTREEYYSRIAEIAGVSEERVHAIDRQQHSRDDAMIQFVRETRRNYKTGLLSNIDEGTINTLFPEKERQELFDGFVISGAVGLAKPSVELFTYAAESVGALPEECVMIDDMPSNVEGAKLAGMHAICFSSRRQLEQDLKMLLT